MFAISVMVFGQPKTDFAKTRHDFGKFNEGGGTQTFSFEFVNTGNSPLVISNVVSSCGCTAPDWTKSPIEPGKKGFVKATYDPMGRPGKFVKTVTVYSNAKPEVVVLVIEGEVEPREKTIEEIYRWPIGGLRFENNHLAFTNVNKGEKKIRVMPLINASKVPVKLEFDNLPPYLTIISRPETIKPGEKAVIEATLNTDNEFLKQQWGNHVEMARLKINGEVQTNEFLYVSANLLEDFSKLTKEEAANPPVISMETKEFDFGKVGQNKSVDIEFFFTNTGKRDLIIRHVKPTCGCTAMMPTKDIIKPGERGSVKAQYSSGMSKGPQYKNIFIYTNDPRNPEVMLMIKGEVTEN